MNRIVVGAVSALLLASAGVFWWQGRAELERGAPPPDLAADRTAGEAPIELPSADTHGKRGAALPGVAKHSQSTEEKRFARYDKNKDGHITRPEMLSTRVNAFKKLDTNHDNLLSFEEWAIKTSDRFKQIDRNGDGIITRDELDAYENAKEAKKKIRARAGCPPDRSAEYPAPSKGRRGKGGADSDGEEGDPAN